MGCCGAIKENHCMTTTFAVLIGVIFLMEIGAGIAAYKLKGQVKDLVYINMEDGMQNYNVEKFEGVTHTWDALQRELNCCGTQEYKDWVNTTYSSGENVPDSCCLSTVIGCGIGVLSLSEEEAAMKIHTEGCLDIFSNQKQHRRRRWSWNWHWAHSADWNGVRNILGNNHQEAIRDCLSLDYSTKQDFYVKSTLFYQNKIILQSNRLLILALRPEY